MKFSNRERFLIGFLMLMIIWAAAYGVIIGPGRENLIHTQELRDILEEERAVTELYLSNYRELEDQLDNLEDSHDSEDFFYKDIDDAYMDRNLQDMAARAGVSIERMSIGEASYIKLSGSGGEKSGGRETAGSGGELSGGKETAGSGGEKSGGRETAGSGGEKSSGKETAGKEQIGSGEKSGDGELGLVDNSVDGERPSVMESVITLEVTSPDIEGVIAFTEELYRDQKSLSVSYLDMENEYGRDSEGQEIMLGMKGIMEVIYYYEETR